MFHFLHYFDFVRTEISPSCRRIIIVDSLGSKNIKVYPNEGNRDMFF